MNKINKEELDSNDTKETKDWSKVVSEIDSILDINDFYIKLGIDDGVN